MLQALRQEALSDPKINGEDLHPSLAVDMLPYSSARQGMAFVLAIHRSLSMCRSSGRQSHGGLPVPRLFLSDGRT